MDNVLEKQRRTHEEIERLEQAIVDQFLAETTAHRAKLARDHKVNEYVDSITSKSQNLLNLYEDKDGARAAEIEKISGASEFSEFYQRLKDIKDYHRRYPNEVVEPMELEFMQQEYDEENDGLDRLFSGEEGFGKYLDLHALHDQFVNLKNVKKLNYLTYLSEFDNFATIPKQAKNLEYRKYIQSLQSYLEDFIKRVNPLKNLDQIKRTAIEEMSVQWEKGTYPGWERSQSLEDESMKKDLFCPACKKQYSKNTVYEAHLKSRKHMKAANNLLNNGGVVDPLEVEKAQKREEKNKDDREKSIAQTEALIVKLAEVLGKEREDTKANVERKQTLTDKERNLEVEAEEVEVEDSDSEDEERIYNPLKLPLGWDGKPIPYWLYKLHGLGVEYTCEICGNYVYMGRKAFDRHFQEWRHAHGMRCLGIPNTRHFHDITLIEDAYALWDRQKVSNKTEDFKSEVMEEFEDADGNVFNRKTYEDLKRQGLI
ncbi:Pre-mRNA-splicing factor sap61 [Basidiobolus ranarum]|uniref:Pre-mRNA-splicing factor sap61 n=1 Tax=Basidiobolus ranarum TaxID=34480 RepID=A0ABR2WAL3_9FUNG